MSLSMVPGTPCDLQVIVPSKGRPEAARELVRVFGDTCEGNTRLVFAVNDDDPTRDAYSALVTEFGAEGIPVELGYVQAENMVQALNQAAMFLGDVIDPEWRPFALGFMGDDHRPRTKGWDAIYVEKLRAGITGFVYGDDGFQHNKLPTQIAICTDIVRAMGYMAPPCLKHMYVDNAWKALGTSTGLLWYLPDVLVEHMHPAAGKAEWDANYLKVNNPEFVGADGARYRDWLRDEGPEGYNAAVTAIGKLLALKASA